MTAEAHSEADELLVKIEKELLRGSRKFLIWGANAVCDELVRKLRSKGLLSLVAGIIDEIPRTNPLHIGNILVSDSTRLAALDFDFLVITDNANKEEALLRFAQIDRRTPKALMTGTKHQDFVDSKFFEILKTCRIRPKAGGYPEMLTHIYQSLVYVTKQKLHGGVAEFGVYEGGTTAFIAKTLRSLGWKGRIYGFDTFQGFPPPRTVLDQFYEAKYGRRNFGTVRKYLEPLGVELVKGDIVETYSRIKGMPLVFTFFDTDNYTPTNAALELCYNQTVRGGVLAFDHFFCQERWLETIGERIAIRRTLSGRRVFNLQGTGIFIKF